MSPLMNIIRNALRRPSYWIFILVSPASWKALFPNQALEGPTIAAFIILVWVHIGLGIFEIKSLTQKFVFGPKLEARKIFGLFVRNLGKTLLILSPLWILFNIAIVWINYHKLLIPSPNFVFDENAPQFELGIPQSLMAASISFLFLSFPFLLSSFAVSLAKQGTPTIRETISNLKNCLAHIFTASLVFLLLNSFPFVWRFMLNLQKGGANNDQLNLSLIAAHIITDVVPHYAAIALVPVLLVYLATKVVSASSLIISAKY